MRGHTAGSLVTLIPGLRARGFATGSQTTRAMVLHTSLVRAGTAICAELGLGDRAPHQDLRDGLIHVINGPRLQFLLAVNGDVARLSTCKAWALGLSELRFPTLIHPVAFSPTVETLARRVSTFPFAISSASLALSFTLGKPEALLVHREERAWPAVSSVAGSGMKSSSLP